MIYRYLLIAIASVSILMGIQIPNFVDQYEKRLDAHLIEVTENLRGFQEIADRYHQGSLEALIREHEESKGLTFRDESKPLKAMYERYKAFRDEQLSLKTNLAGKAVHLVLKGNRPLVDETYSNYSFNIPLNTSAVISGLLFAALALGIVEVVVTLIAWSFRLTYRSTGHAKRPG
jgi:hypothetical protein